MLGVKSEFSISLFTIDRRIEYFFFGWMGRTSYDNIYVVQKLCKPRFYVITRQYTGVVGVMVPLMPFSEEPCGQKPQNSGAAGKHELSRRGGGDSLSLPNWLLRSFQGRLEGRQAGRRERKTGRGGRK